MEQNELITSPSDKRKYRGKKKIKRKPKGLIIPVTESSTGENLTFLNLESKKVITKQQFLKEIKAGLHQHYCIKTIHGKETPRIKARPLLLQQPWLKRGETKSTSVIKRELLLND